MSQWACGTEQDPGRDLPSRLIEPLTGDSPLVPPEQQLQLEKHHVGACRNANYQALPLDLLNQTPWEWEPATCVLRSPWIILMH